MTEPAGDERTRGRGEPPPWGTPPPATRRTGWGQPPPWQPPRQRRSGCGGCLLALVTVTVWFVVALFPLGLVDDVVGPVTDVRWPTPVNGSGEDPALPDQEVTVPAGSPMYVTGEPSELISVDCEVQDPEGGWRPLTRLPFDSRPEPGDEVRRFEFVATEGTVRLRCGGDEHAWVTLWRDDDGAHRRYTLLVHGVRAGWLTTFTALILTPVVVRRVRRNRAAARAASPPAG